MLKQLWMTQRYKSWATSVNLSKIGGDKGW